MSDNSFYLQHKGHLCQPRPTDPSRSLNATLIWLDWNPERLRLVALQSECCWVGSDVAPLMFFWLLTAAWGLDLWRWSDADPGICSAHNKHHMPGRSCHWPTSWYMASHFLTSQPWAESSFTSSHPVPRFCPIYCIAWLGAAANLTDEVQLLS